MKYKIGDHVKLKKIRPEFPLSALSGKITEIINANESYYVVRRGASAFCITDEHIENQVDTELIVIKDEFVRCVEYIRKINNTKLEDLDLSDFGSKKKVADAIKQFKYYGLSNRDVILDLLGENRVMILTGTKEKK